MALFGSGIVLTILGPALAAPASISPPGLIARLGPSQITPGNAVHVLAFSPDGKRLALGTSDADIILWDVAPRKELRRLSGHRDRVNALAFTPDGKTLVSASYGDFALHRWDIASGRKRPPLEGPAGAVLSLAVSPDGKLLAAGRWSHSVQLWDLATRKRVRDCPGHTGWVHAIAFTPDGKLLVSGSGDFHGHDDTLRLWDVASGREVGRPQPQRQTTCLAISPDGKWLAAGGEDRLVRLWRLPAGESRGQLDGHAGGLRALAFAPDGKTLASTGTDGTIRLWELATGRERRRFLGHPGAVYTLAFSPDGRLLASGGDKTEAVWLWDVRR